MFASTEQITTFELGGATNSPGIADKNRLIIEEKFFHYNTKSGADPSAVFNLANTKLRYGLVKDRVEARMEVLGLMINSQDAGFSNTALGVKLRFLNESYYLPVTELISSFQIPLGSSDLRNPGLNHSYMLVLGKQWTEKWGSIVNLSLDLASFRSNFDGVASAVSIPYAFNLHYNPQLQLTIFSHIFGAWNFTGEVPDPLSVDLGASYAVTNDFALVTWVSKGLNDAAADVSVDFGIVYRL